MYFIICTDISYIHTYIHNHTYNQLIIIKCSCLFHLPPTPPLQSMTNKLTYNTHYVLRTILKLPAKSYESA